MAQDLRILDVDCLGLFVFNGSIDDKEEVASLIDRAGEWDYTLTFYSIGEGENGLDTYFTDEEIEEWIADGLDESDIVKKIENAGYTVGSWQIHKDTIYLEDDEPSDDYDECGYDPYLGCWTGDC